MRREFRRHFLRTSLIKTRNKMTIPLYLLLIGGLLILISQASYALVIAKVDLSTAERRVHCVHHAVHSICGLLTILATLGLILDSPQSAISTICAIAWGLIIIDAAIFLICNTTHSFAIRREAIMRKWRSEKVVGAEHDREVSVYRTLKEITEKNLLRDIVHASIFVILLLISHTSSTL